MGLGDICDTGLGLGLGCRERPVGLQSDHQEKKKMKLSLRYDHLLPSLTLGLSEDHMHHQSANTNTDAAMKAHGESAHDVHQQASSHSGASSFSNSSVKKERDLGASEEVEGERFSSRVSDEDEEGSPRKKLRLTKEQSAVLEDSFKEHSTLNPKQKQALAEQLNLRPRQVEVWFQNRRARTKLKQTEVDCELLKKCCETLTEENKRLQKELQELKSLKLAASFYMQLPAATLTMCPSCERLGNGSESSSRNPFGVGPAKAHLYSPFSHPSAAC